MFGLVGSSLRTRSLLYTQLAQALDSGIAAASALRLLDRAGADQRGAAAAAAIARGQTLVAAFDGAFGLPRPDRLALSAAERAGRLPACLRQLSADLDAERAERREFWLSIAYPLLLMHVVVPATSMPLLLLKPGVFFARTFAATAIIWGSIFAGAWIHRRGSRSPAYVRVLRSIPLVGPIVRYGAFVHFFRALVELYGSGVNFTEALDASGSVVGDAPPFDDFARASAAARGGAPMPAVFATLRSLDPPLRALLETAATTGDLENGLRRVIKELEEQWRDATRRFLGITSYVLYAAVACGIGWSVINFWTGYFDQYAELDRHIHGR